MTGPRTYDPVVGRFLQGDPTAKAAASPFAYSSIMPLRRVDPGGYQDADPSQVTDDEPDFFAEPVKELVKILPESIRPEIGNAEAEIIADASTKYVRGAAESVASGVTSPYFHLQISNTVMFGPDVVEVVASEFVSQPLGYALGEASHAPGDFYHEGGKSSADALDTALKGASLATLAGALRSNPLASGRNVHIHGAQRMHERGFTDDVVENIIRNSARTRVGKVDDMGRKTWEYTDVRGNTVVTDEWGAVITVFSPLEAGRYIPKAPRPPR